MSLNFGQFATPTLPIAATDKIVGYQLVGAALIPTCTQYTFAQVAAYVNATALTPPVFGAAMLAWFLTLSTSLPPTAGVLWNNGGTLSLS
jgi:hypothetical protein